MNAKIMFSFFFMTRFSDAHVKKNMCDSTSRHEWIAHDAEQVVTHCNLQLPVCTLCPCRSVYAKRYILCQEEPCLTDAEQCSPVDAVDGILSGSDMPLLTKQLLMTEKPLLTDTPIKSDEKSNGNQSSDGVASDEIFKNPAKSTTPSTPLLPQATPRPNSSTMSDEYVPHLSNSTWLYVTMSLVGLIAAGLIVTYLFRRAERVRHSVYFPSSLSE